MFLIASNQFNIVFNIDQPLSYIFDLLLYDTSTVVINTLQRFQIALNNLPPLTSREYIEYARRLTDAALRANSNNNNAVPTKDEIETYFNANYRTIDALIDFIINEHLYIDIHKDHFLTALKTHKVAYNANPNLIMNRLLLIRSTCNTMIRRINAIRDDIDDISIISDKDMVKIFKKIFIADVDINLVNYRLTPLQRLLHSTTITERPKTYTEWIAMKNVWRQMVTTDNAVYKFDTKLPPKLTIRFHSNNNNNNVPYYRRGRGRGYNSYNNNNNRRGRGSFYSRNIFRGNNRGGYNTRGRGSYYPRGRGYSRTPGTNTNYNNYRGRTPCYNNRYNNTNTRGRQQYNGRGHGKRSFNDTFPGNAEPMKKRFKPNGNAFGACWDCGKIGQTSVECYSTRDIHNHPIVKGSGMF